MYQKFLLSLLVLLLILPMGCKKEKEESPKPDFGKITCRMNGIIWQSSPGDQSITSSDMDHEQIMGIFGYMDSEYLSVGGCQFKDTSVLLLEINPVLTGLVGSYVDSTVETVFVAYISNFNKNDSGEPDIGYLHTKIKINISSWNESSRRLSGTFEGELQSIPNMKKIKLTEGVLDKVLILKD